MAPRSRRDRVISSMKKGLPSVLLAMKSSMSDGTVASPSRA
jgi:hypothetical protein